MAGSREAALLRELLNSYGQTYAAEAGISLADRPSPLYQLLVLSTLISARISAAIAVAAARELFTAGYRTPRAMLRASWQDRVDALGRGHYRRYDESTATRLGHGAELALRRWRGDLRRLHGEATGDPERLAALLCEFPGIGAAGAAIFLREVQAAWPDVAPYTDRLVLEGARKIGLPEDAGGLAGLTSSPAELARLAAALVRVARSRRAADELTTAAGAA